MAAVFSFLQSACELGIEGAFLLLTIPAGFICLLRAKCSWDEAEADIQHILLTGFPPADEMWLKVKTQSHDTIYGSSRFYQSPLSVFSLLPLDGPSTTAAEMLILVCWAWALCSPANSDAWFWICNLLYTAEGSLGMCMYMYIKQSKQRCACEVWRMRHLKYPLFNFEHISVYEEKLETVKWWPKQSLLPEFRLSRCRVSETSSLR